MTGIKSEWAKPKENMFKKSVSKNKVSFSYFLDLFLPNREQTVKKLEGTAVHGILQAPLYNSHFQISFDFE